MLTTAGVDFDADRGVEASSSWTGETDFALHTHLACAEYGRRREALSSLQESLGPGAVRPVSSTPSHGACFIVTASHDTANDVSKDWDRLELLWRLPECHEARAWAACEHSDCHSTGGSDCSAGRLSTTHGLPMRQGSVHGLMVELSPGTDLGIDR